MRQTSALMIGILVLLLSPSGGYAQTLDNVAKAMGTDSVRSIQITGSGMMFGVGQSYVPNAPWPKFNLKSYTRAVNYETASLRDEVVRTQAEDPVRGGANQPIRGELRQIFVVSGDHAWNVVGETVNPAPAALTDRQFQLWATPHGVIKAAIANKATIQGRMISFSVPGRFTARVTVNDRNLIEKIDA